MKAKVYLVGAGPGDPGLITVKGRACIQNADVVIYDYLASPALLKYARKSAELIYVGKKGGDHTLSQDEINTLIVQKAKSGGIVCRLKGGDPYIFGRGGEEAEVLFNAGIAFEIVPGITSAIAAAAYAGIPLTHRDYSQSVVFVTGHLKDGSMNLNWKGLALPQQTVVFYMGLKGLPVICEQLVAHGLSPETPMALVQQATTPRQRVFTGTLGTMVEKIGGEEIKPPTLIIVGDVVRLHEKLKWFTSELEMKYEQ